ncbi:MAG: DUF1801 domain-containing protein [Spirochaetales bacterium]
MENSVEAYLTSLSDERKRTDSWKLIEIMQRITGCEPVMWGTSIIGFGDVHLKYASGREVDWFAVGFAPRKQAISLYLTCDVEQFANRLEELGPHKHGKGCLYIKRLSDIDVGVLETLISEAAVSARKQHA